GTVAAARVVPLSGGERLLQRAEERQRVGVLLGEDGGDVEGAAEEVDRRPRIAARAGEGAHEQRDRERGGIVAEREAGPRGGRGLSGSAKRAAAGSPASASDSPSAASSPLFAGIHRSSFHLRAASARWLLS